VSVEDILVQEGISRAMGYTAMGMSMEDAAQKAIGDVLPGYDPSSLQGLGQTSSTVQSTDGTTPSTDPGLIQDVVTDVKAISTVVSPWLWILSIGGFAMSLYNTDMIKKMYGSWKRAKQHLLH
jgi:hypothetical protein